MKKTLIIATLATAVATANSVFAITIVEGNNNTDTDNVLFIESDPGTEILGSFNATPGYTIRFTSDSNDGMLQSNPRGQARVRGFGANEQLTDLNFELLDDATFTKAVLNINAGGENNVEYDALLAINYLNGGGSLHTETIQITGNGENFFTITADEGERITAVSLSSEETFFAGVRQVRIGGFAPNQVTEVPEVGATAALLGVGLLSLAASRRRKS